MAHKVNRQIRNSKFEIRKIILLLLVVFCSAAGATTLERGVSSSIAYENLPDFEEVYRIRIENKVNGSIEASSDAGESWQSVGRVLYPTDKVSKNGYSASKWMAEGRVVATSVNAIHIKSGSAEVTRTIFSLLPKEMLQPPKRYRSYISPNSSIYTDIAAGTGIFGGGLAPFVGNVVLVSQPGLPILPLDADYVPAIGDTFYILVDRPLDMPKEIVLENRFGGRISISYFSGDEKVIGQVLRPVSGVGRFEGSKFVDPGRIRANHAGVIDISVSPLGKLGGFQIVPALHGSEMTYLRRMTQWMVIGPARADDPSLEGMAPFYKFFIQPNYRPDDLEGEDWEERLLSRYLVDVKYEGGEEWQPMPVYALQRSFPLPYWADRVFDKVSHIRILFPVEAGDNG
ncbi:hypothetical protein ACFL1W_00580 [Candidatus Margulisiibacteriota bacterium]